jgi:hypothetical protein
MNDLETIFARDPASLNSKGEKGFTDEELLSMIRYYREQLMKSKAPKPAKEKRQPGAKIDLDDLDV